VRGRRRERGSIVLFVLFVCLSVTVLVQVLSVVVLCAERGRQVEGTGRRLIATKDEALAGVRQGLVALWEPRTLTSTGDGDEEVWTVVAEVPDSEGWALDVTTGQPAAVSPIAVSAWAERGRDGLDLPLAALVANTATWAAGRSAACVEAEGAGSGAGGAEAPLVWFKTTPAGWDAVPGQLQAGTRAEPWSLEEGWRTLFVTLAAGADAAPGVGAARGVWAVEDTAGTPARLPDGWGTSATEPGLAVVLGSAWLDARNAGERWGVIVVDGGDARLDGTRLHGGLFATGRVDLGANGTVVFSRSVVRWSTDRSLARVRLVPGSRRESM
jgi:hypothetical protein